MEEIKPNNSLYLTRGINHDRYQAILKYAGESILDVGCGNGAYIFKLKQEHPEYKITGLDYQAFDTWQQNPDSFIIGNADNLPFDDNSFDTITLFEVLEHLPDPEKHLREYLRVCRKNLILTVPNCEITTGMKSSLLTYYHYIDSTHVNFFTMNELIKTIENSGFKVKHNYYINKINFFPLLEEAFSFNINFTGRIIKKLLSKRTSREYYITSLVVAEK